MKKLLPGQADNNYNFNRIIIYVFALLAAVTVGRSLIHVFAPDGGANSIASMIIFSGTPDPNAVVYNIFALWGLSQLLMGFVYVIVLIKYKNLIPLMYVFILIEYVMRMVIGIVIKPLGELYFSRTVPGAVGNYILIPLALLMIIWALTSQKKGQE